MRTSLEFIEEQIVENGRKAASAALSNQRSMFLRAQAAWKAQADKLRRAEAERNAQKTGAAAV